MTPTHHCPECGKPIAAGVAQGLCPACLLAQALASRTAHAEHAGSSSSTPLPTPAELAAAFPQFEILECLGRGGMGVVYKARQKSLNRLVAIKLLAPERVRDARFAERFAREAELLAQLSHPHIVTIHDFGEAGGRFYIVMEFVDGITLRDLVREGKLSPGEALAIVPPLCDALQYAHAKGIVHRDIKPENLLLDREGRVKIADFGIAALAGPEAGGRAGTPPYMAPEQRAPEGASVDHRADIYALGVVLYELLTGERPTPELIAPSRKVSIDVRLDAVVLRALEGAPERRYQTAAEFRTQVETAVAETAAPPAPQTPAAVPALSVPLRSERARVCWQREPHDPRLFAPSTGRFALFTDRLEVSSGAEVCTIPLTSIRSLHLAVPPIWWSPAGHRFVAVGYVSQEGGPERLIAFQPGTPAFRFPSMIEEECLEWLRCLSATMHAATGRRLETAPMVLHLAFKSGPQKYLWLLLLLPLLSSFAIPAMVAASQKRPLLSSLEFLLLPQPIYVLAIVFGSILLWRRHVLRQPIGKRVSRKWLYLSIAAGVAIFLLGTGIFVLRHTGGSKRLLKALPPPVPAQERTSTAPSGPVVLAELLVAEVPEDFSPAAEADGNLAALLPPGSRILAMPRVMFRSGTSARLDVGDIEGHDPSGVYFLLEAEVDPEPLNRTYRFKIDATSWTRTAPGTRTSQGATVNGNGTLGSWIVFTLGSAEGGRKRVGALMLRRDDETR